MAETQGLIPQNNPDARRRAAPSQPALPQRFQDNVPLEEKRHEKAVFWATVKVWLACLVMMFFLIFLQSCYFVVFLDSAVVISAFTCGLAFATPYIVPMKFCDWVTDNYGDFYPNRPRRHPQLYYKLIFCMALLMSFSGGLCAGAFFGQWGRNIGPVVHDVSADSPVSKLGTKMPSIIYFNEGVMTSKKYRMSEWFTSFQVRSVTRISVCVAALVEDDENYFHKPIYYFAVNENVQPCVFPNCFGNHGRGGCAGFVTRAVQYPQVVIEKMALTQNFTASSNAVFVALVPPGVNPHANVTALFTNGWIAVLVTFLAWPLLVLLILFAVLKFGMVHNHLDFTWGLK